MTDAASAQLPVAIDVMGGDGAPHAIVAGALLAHAQGIPIMLVGDSAVVRPLIRRDTEIEGLDTEIEAGAASLTLVHADDAVRMEERPLEAIRRRPESSVVVAMRALAEGRAGAVVSCGNTGATVVAAMRTLGTEDGVERVAVGVELPTASGPGLAGRSLLLLDAGASVDVRPSHLVGFARLGRSWALEQGRKAPRLAILSNGEERTKGTQRIRDTLAEAAEAGLALVPMEPGPALAGGADVLVTDGFTGNVLLKALEAAAAVTMRRLGHGSAPDLSWRHRGGGRLLGVSGVVLIGHGRADATAVASTIEQAWRSSS